MKKYFLIAFIGLIFIFPGILGCDVDGDSCSSCTKCPVGTKNNPLVLNDYSSSEIVFTSEIGRVKLYIKVINIPYLNNTGLVLLGISIGTNFSSLVITAVQDVSVNRPLKLKMDQESNSWWKDLLMDDFGQFSVTRLQQLIFTVVFVLIYVITFCRNNLVDYPEFHEQAMYLMGISAGGYLIGKGVYK